MFFEANSAAQRAQKNIGITVQFGYGRFWIRVSFTSFRLVSDSGKFNVFVSS